MKPAVLILALALVAGCGGSSADKQAKRDFLTQAETICTKTLAERKALQVPLAMPQVIEYAKKLVAIADRTATSLLALNVPAADRKELQAKVFQPLQAQVTVAHGFMTKVLAAQRAQNTTELQRLFANPPTDTKVDLRWMKRYGFNACVDAADTSG